jgi:hypothetical protein
MCYSSSGQAGIITKNINPNLNKLTNISGFFDLPAALIRKDV